MSLSGAYVQGYGKIKELFTKIRDGQAPQQFTQQLLKDWGFSSSNDRQFLSLLKSLNFLSPDGKPTTLYHSYRDHSKSEEIMGDALKEAYKDIFLIKANPTADDKKAIEGKFKSYHNSTDRVAQLMTNTFLALLALANLNTKNKPLVEEKESEIPKSEIDIVNESKEQPRFPIMGHGLYYNIQIHLPATKDVEVYNAIFKSLKEHLFEV
jgi:hypothetical protein